MNTETVWYSFYIADNGDKASSQGIELELEGYFSDSFHYRLGYTHVDAELDKDFISTQTGGVVAVAGSVLPGAPTDVISLSLDNTWQINGNMDLVAGLNIYNQSKANAYIDNTNMRNEVYDSFSLIGATLTFVSDNWTAQLYGKNLGDEAGASGGFVASHWSYDTGIFENWYGNGNRQFIVQPRTVGLRVTYNF